MVAPEWRDCRCPAQQLHHESLGTCWEEKCGGRDGEPAATSVAAWRRRRQTGRTDGGRDARPICAAFHRRTKDRRLASLSRSARLAPRAPVSPRTAFETPRLPRASGTELTMTVLERLGKSLSLRRGSRDSPRLRKQFTTADAAANLAPLRWAQAPGPRDATAPGRRRPPEQTHPVPRRRHSSCRRMCHNQRAATCLRIHIAASTTWRTWCCHQWARRQRPPAAATHVAAVTLDAWSATSHAIRSKPSTWWSSHRASGEGDGWTLIMYMLLHAGLPVYRSS